MKQKKREMTNYFSGDFHLGHTNILRFDRRLFNSIEEHDQHLIKMCMRTLSSGDNFYYLGDFSLTRPSKTESYLATLQGSGANLFFIKGNHDKKDNIKLFQKYGTFLGEKKTIKIQQNDKEYVVVLDHFANRVWDRSHHGSLHLYGHSHDGLDKNGEVWGRSMDAGIMSALRINGVYSLFPFSQIVSILTAREPKIIDHHGLKIRGYEESED